MEEQKRETGVAAYSEDDILGVLDDTQGGQCWEWPDFQHLDYDMMASRIVAYRDEGRWAVVFSVVEWSSDHALTAKAMPMGNCVRIPGAEDYEARRDFYAEQEIEMRREMQQHTPEAMWSLMGLDKPASGPEFEARMRDRVMSEAGFAARILDTIQFDFDYDDESLEPRDYVKAVRIRGKEIDLASLEFQPEDEDDVAFELGLAVLEKYRDEIMPTDAELARFFPDGMPPRFLVINEWHHSKWGLASEWEVFQQIAHAMAKGDASLYRPTEHPNTDWRNWVDK